MRKPSKLITILLVIIFSQSLNASVIKSNGTGGGAWGNALTWSTGTVPNCGDTITVLAGDVVTIEDQQDYSACGSPMFVTVNGTLDFPVNGPKLRLPCNSGVVINIGGLLSASGSGGGGNANFLEICSTVVWSKGDGNVFGPVTFGTPPADPVVIEEFDVSTWDKSTYRLSWNANSEHCSNSFIVEKSTNGIDYEQITEIPVVGDLNSRTEYEAFDDSPSFGTSYYRIKQTDCDDNVRSVGLVATNYSQDEEGICTLKVYPNPCVGACTISLEDCPLHDSQVEVELYDAMGKKIVNRITPKSKDQDISFHLNSSNNLSPGVYIVRSTANGKDQSSKVIVK